MNTLLRAPGVVSLMAIVSCAGLAQPVSAQTFTFSNDCGTGSWGSSCSLGAGMWQSNWGRTGPNPALLIPGAADTCLLAGTVNLDVSATVSTLTVPTGATLSWPSSSLSLASFSNSGTVSVNGGGNKFLTGSALNNSGAQWSVATGALYFTDATSLTNNSLITLGDGGAFRRSGGSTAGDVLTNNGTVHVTAGGGSINDVTVVSTASAVWRSDGGSPFTFNGVAPSGVFVGDLSSPTDAIGTINLAGNTTLATTPAGGPWGWTTATFNTGPFTLTNQGKFQMTGGGNRFLSGAAVNAPGAVWDNAQGSLYFNPIVPATTIANSGLLTIGQNASLRRNGGPVSGAVLSNAGVVRATQAGASINDITLMSSGGVWAADAGASLEFASGSLAGTFVGDFTGQCYLEGTFNLAADTTLSTAPTTVNPWRWTNATVNAGAGTFTNAGWLQTESASNKFISGAVVNAASGEWSHTQGALYLSPVGPATTLQNDGLLTLGGNVSINRNGGAIGSAVFINNSFVQATLPSAIIQGLTIVSNNGLWQTDEGATLDLQSDNLSGTFVGNHSGAAALAGGIALAGNTSFTTLPTSPNPWRWTNANVVTGGWTLFNSGRMETTTVSNKFLTGNAVNAATGTWTMGQGAFYLAPTGVNATFTNSGTLNLAANTAVNRNGGTTPEATLTNLGVVTATGDGTAFNNLTLSSLGGTWRTLPATSLAFNSTNLSGVFTFDNAGSLTNSGAMACVADTTFTTTPSSVNPFQWTAANIDAAGFTLTNAGRIETLTTNNKFLAGLVVNGPGASWLCSQGNLFFNQSVSGMTRLTNNGTFTLANGTSLPRNGGTQANAVFDNHGLLHVTGSGSSVSNLTLNNIATGTIRIADGASLEFPDNWAMSSGRLEGNGSFSSNTTMTVAGGVLAPGLSGGVGTLSCARRYAQSAGGTLEIALVNTGSQQTASRLNLTSTGFFGQAQLGGALRVTLPAGVSPPPIGGTSYVIVDAPGGLSGSFASIVDANPIADYRYTVTYTPTQAVLHVVKRCGHADVGGTGADTNFDGVLDNNDFVVFIDMFFNQDPDADVGSTGGVQGSDGAWDNNDFVVYIDMFFSGCH